MIIYIKDVPLLALHPVDRLAGTFVFHLEGLIQLYIDLVYLQITHEL